MANGDLHVTRDLDKGTEIHEREFLSPFTGRRERMLLAGFVTVPAGCVVIADRAGAAYWIKMPDEDRG